MIRLLIPNPPLHGKQKAHGSTKKRDYPELRHAHLRFSPARRGGANQPRKTHLPDHWALAQVVRLTASHIGDSQSQRNA